MMPILLLIFVLIAVPQLLLYRQIFFVQKRPGQGGRHFYLIKFQTMRSGEGTDQERLTSFGELLRNTAVDELPQVFNILKGEMSFIGPRPLLVEYMSLYSPYHHRRHDVKPGITGLAQINGLKVSSWSEKLDLDVSYVETISLTTDCYIAWKTVYLLIAGAGQSKEHLDEKFTGYE